MYTAQSFRAQMDDIYLLASRELELGSSQSLNDMLLVLGLGTNWHDHLTNVDTGHSPLGFTKGTTHSSLEPKDQSKSNKNAVR